MQTSKYFKREDMAYLRKLFIEKAGCFPQVLLSQIFTRSSYSSEFGGENNEKLEFIGDSVLGFYVVKILTERFGRYNNDFDFSITLCTHKISELKKELVSNKNLAKIIDEWDIVKYLIVSKSDIQNHIDEQEKVKADLFEAILGAIAIHSKYNPETLEKAVYKMLSMDRVIKDILQTEYRPKEFNINNAVNTLKELAEHGDFAMPEYEFTGPKYLGYDKDGNPIWGCICRAYSIGLSISVVANSKKDAKKAAAYQVLIQHYGYPNEYGPNDRQSVWGYKNNHLVPEMEFVANKFRESKYEKILNDNK